MSKTFKIAQAQVLVPASVDEAFEKAERFAKLAKEQGADVFCLPEMFCCPYETKQFPVYAQPDAGTMKTRAAAIAKKYGLVFSAGSFPESDEAGHVYNTAYVFGPGGSQLAKHRKMHLFDIDVKGGQAFRESDTLTPGDQITVFDTPFCKMGVLVCYDIRFPELSRLMALKGAQVLLLPGAYNMTTGPAHWELCHRGQAMFNQVFVCATSPARDLESSYHAWGHSMVVDPWGTVLSEMDEKEGLQITEIDLDRLSAVREQIPLLRQRRTDLYTLEEK
ncbi:MAG: carbon-nitrogen hydrolase family protein [Firmicutes bacterium]|nr:carbon-nitrogen hydrolase family protein [Bacillota bacterium]